eukprot:m.360087 g.360087  ORF g.360087 m.360087 type:complete len:1857 (-) comp19953_c2_seq10:30-5600(-)
MQQQQQPQHEDQQQKAKPKKKKTLAGKRASASSTPSGSTAATRKKSGASAVAAQSPGTRRRTPSAVAAPSPGTRRRTPSAAGSKTTTKKTTKAKSASSSAAASGRSSPATATESKPTEAKKKAKRTSSSTSAASTTTKKTGTKSSATSKPGSRKSSVSAAAGSKSATTSGSAIKVSTPKTKRASGPPSSLKTPVKQTPAPKLVRKGAGKEPILRQGPARKPAASKEIALSAPASATQAEPTTSVTPAEPAEPTQPASAGQNQPSTPVQEQEPPAAVATSIAEEQHAVAEEVDLQQAATPEVCAPKTTPAPEPEPAAEAASEPQPASAPATEPATEPPPATKPTSESRTAPAPTTVPTSEPQVAPALQHQQSDPVPVPVVLSPAPSRAKPGLSPPSSPQRLPWDPSAVSAEEALLSPKLAKDDVFDSLDQANPFVVQQAAASNPFVDTPNSPPRPQRTSALFADSPSPPPLPAKAGRNNMAPALPPRSNTSTQDKQPAWNPFAADPGAIVGNPFADPAMEPPAWNPFMHMESNPFESMGGDADGNEQEAGASAEELAAVRKAALQASVAFHEVMNMAAAEAEEEKVLRKLEQEEQAEKEAKLHQEEEEREQAFMRREAARKARLAGAADELLRLQAQEEAAVAAAAEVPRVPQAKGVPVGNFSIPPPEAELANPDPDPDIDEANRLLAQVARFVRARFTAYEYEATDSDAELEADSEDEDKDEDDVVAKFAALLDGADVAESPVEGATPEQAALHAGMHRLERLLSLLPALHERALGEVETDVMQIQRVERRILQARRTLTDKLDSANKQLQSLGGKPHDIAEFLDLASDNTKALLLPGGKAPPQVAQHLSVNMAAEDDADDADEDNFMVLSQMGLLSKTSRANVFEAPTSRRSRPVAEDDLSDLLESLEASHKETQVSITEAMEWTPTDESLDKFTDFQVEFESDDPVFPKSSSQVRRAYKDCKKLRKHVEGLDVEGLPRFPRSAVQHHAIAEWLTAIVRHSQLQDDTMVHKFFFDEGRFHKGVKDPKSFSSPLVLDMDRAELASLPEFHLRAIAANDGASVRGCVTRFEFADRILAKARGEDPEEAVPIAFDEIQGEGFLARRATDTESKLEAATLSGSASGVASAAPAERVAMPSRFKIAVKVEPFLEEIGLAAFLPSFHEKGYDDMRVVASLSQADMTELGLESEQRHRLLKAGLDWQAKASSCLLLDNWALETHRAGASGVLEKTPLVLDPNMDAAAKKSLASRAVAGDHAGGEDYFMRDKDGKIDLKRGDELVEFGWADSADWDPTPVLKLLYENFKPGAAAPAEPEDANAPAYVSMQGFLEKLPKNVNKPSIRHRWLRRYFKARDGELFFYEDHRSTRPLGFITLRGGTVSFCGGNVLQIHDPKTRTCLTLKASSTAELEDWKAALDAEAAGTVKRQHDEDDGAEAEQALRDAEMRKTLIFDIGSASMRAGFAGPDPWPQVYEPCVVATYKEDASRMVVGPDACHPRVRSKATLRHPLRVGDRIGQVLDMPAYKAICGDLYARMGVQPSERALLLTEPQQITAKEREGVAEYLFESMDVPSLCMQSQPMLSFYSYGAPSGVIVDIGERIDIVPIEQGSVIEKGVTSLRFGGRNMTESMTRMLTEHGHRFFSQVEQYIGRLIKERVCFVAPNFEEACAAEEAGNLEPGVVDARRFIVPDGTKSFEVGGAMFRSPEGLFQPKLWGKDCPGISQLVYEAIQACDIHERKTMYRNVYLSGGTTMLPGLGARLQGELQALIPASCAATVHEGPHRLHAAFQGASVLSSLSGFEQLSVWRSDWEEIGPSALLRWRHDTVQASAAYDSDSDAEFDFSARGYTKESESESETDDDSDD